MKDREVRKGRQAVQAGGRAEQSRQVDSQCRARKQTGRQGREGRQGRPRRQSRAGRQAGRTEKASR
jgi:hypothetical protein